jgi:hypothetical protein
MRFKRLERIFFVPTFASSTNDKAIFDLLRHSNGFLKTQSLELCSLATVGTQEHNNRFLITNKVNGNKDFESGTPGRGLQRTVNKE